MTTEIIAAFNESSGGWSADRVVAEPVLNAEFIAECRRRGISNNAVETNLALLNVRKRGLLPSGARRTIVRNQDAYSFAAEIAVRLLERKHQTTLDRVLCDPELAQEFDRIAAEIAPGFTPLEYRWAALRLRKTSKLRPEILGRVVPSEIIGPIPAHDIVQDTLPSQQGLYHFYSHEKSLYIGEASSLKARLKKHLDHSDNKQLARYLWEFGDADVMIEIQVLPTNTRAGVRKAMELELIRSRNPEFNVRR